MAGQMMVGVLQPQDMLLNMHFYIHDGLVKHLRQKGVFVLELSLNDTNIFTKLAFLSHRDDTVVFYGNHFHMRLTSNFITPILLSDMIGRPALGIIDDHPFANFSLDRTDSFSSQVYTCGVEPGFELALSCLRPDYSRFQAHKSAAIIHDVASQVINYAAKDIDVLIIMSIGNDEPSLEPIIQKCLKNGLNRRIVDDYVAAAIDDHETYPFALFAKVVRNVFNIEIQDLAKQHRKLFIYLMAEVLHYLDYWVRNKRRYKMLASLDFDSFSGKVVVLGMSKPVVGMLQGPNVQYVEIKGTDSFTEFLAYIERSRFIVFAHPTYPQTVNNRIYNTLPLGSAVICDYNPALKQAFDCANEGIFIQEEGMRLQDITEMAKDRYDERIALGRNRILQQDNLYEIYYKKLQSILSASSLPDTG